MTSSSVGSGVGSGGRSRQRRLLLLAVFGLSAFYTFRNLDRGWIPHDEGTLAHSAERVLQGDLPHRDYDEVYTGGLSALNAVAFKVLGVNLFTPRIVLFGFFLAWVPTLFYVTTRFVAPPTAALAVLLAVSWSVPNYPAAMPSWYNLFFAVFGLAALLRHTETDDRRWLFAAGLAGGFSILMKITGLYFVAAGLLFLTFREQILSQAEAAEGTEEAGQTSPRAFSLFASGALLLFVILLVLLVGGRSGAVGVVKFIVPFGALAALFIGSEWSSDFSVGSGRRFGTLLRLGVPFLGGVLVPVGALVLVYLLQGAGSDLYRGLFVLPARRLAVAAASGPGPTTMWVALSPVALVAAEAAVPPRIRRVVAGLVLVSAIGVAVVPRSGALLTLMWYLMNALSPLIVIAGVGSLASWKRDVDPLGRQRALAVLAVAAAAMLVQFPYSGPIYLFYTLPALVPAGLLVVTRSRSRERPVFVAAMLFLLVFSVRWFNTGEFFAAGDFPFDPTTQTATFGLERGGGLRVSPEEKERYESLVLALRDMSTSAYTYATPDVPEIYFLSGLRNPTRTLFQLFDDEEESASAILTRLDTLGVNMVVLNEDLRFSPPPSPELLEGLRARYPQAARIGDFIVRWREEGS